MCPSRLAPFGVLLILSLGCASSARVEVPGLPASGSTGESRSLPQDLSVIIKPAQEYRYEDIAWGSPADVVQAKLKRRGLFVIDTTRFGDGVFENSGAAGPRMLLRAGMVDGGLQIISIEWFTTDSTAGPLYDRLKEELSLRYGAPHDTLEVDPEEGEDEIPQVLWGGPRHGGATELSLDISPQHTVVLAYEGPGWAAEADRRSAAGKRP
jgi:hypothetical protein